MDAIKRPLRQPETKCNPANPGFDKSMITMTTNGRGTDLTITISWQACGQSNTRVFTAPYRPQNTFDNIWDLAPETFRMLNGIADAFAVFAQHGFDREP